jgi:hypothetical protein
MLALLSSVFILADWWWELLCRFGYWIYRTPSGRLYKICPVKYGQPITFATLAYEPDEKPTSSICIQRTGQE